MANLNKVLLMGNLTRDPELRHTPSGLAVVEFGMAINRFRKTQDGQRQEETTFVDVTAFGRTAEVIKQYFSKGRPIFVEGHLRYETWTSQEGQKRSKLGVIVDNFQFLESRQQGQGPGQGAPRGGPPSDAHEDDFDGPPLGDDKIPF